MKKKWNLSELNLLELRHEEMVVIDGGNVVDDVLTTAKSVGNAIVNGVNAVAGWVSRNLF